MKYIGFYSVDNLKHERVCNLASRAKMDYLCEIIKETGNSVEIISPSWIDGKEKAFGKKKTIVLDDNKVLFLPSSRSGKSKFVRFFSIIRSLFFVLNKLLFGTKRGETVISYHSLWLSIPLVIAKKLKKLNLVLELEEIYQEIWQTSNFFKKWEHKVINCADKFILSTELLANRIGNKPYMVINGNYKVEKQVAEKPNTSEKILVYAGLIDKIKGGAFISADAVRYLPSDYKLKIIGFGSEGDINSLKELIDEINREKGYTACEYCGIKRGQEYIDFLSSSDITLNPQKITDFARVEFPSKVLSYLSLNKRVVSSPISCLLSSQITELITYSEDDTSKSFAQAILSIDFTKQFNATKKLNELHLSAVNNLMELVNG